MPLTSCSDFLDADNPSSANQNADEYFSKDPSQLRATVYNSLKSIVTVIDLHDQAGDLYINPRGGDDGTYSTFILTPTDGNVTSYYTNCYKIVQYSNALIHYADEGSQLEAEGIFMRSTAYYYLTQMFGAVPYIDWYIQDASRDYPRVAVSEIYDTVIADLESLYSDSKLPATDHTGVASKQAVAALLAKFYLAKGWDCNTTMTNEVNGTYTVNDKSAFTKAAEWAEKAINGVQLTQNFDDKWNFDKQASNPEEIFSVMYQRDSYPGDVKSGGHSLMYNYMGYYGNCVVVGQKGTSSGGTNNTSLKSLSLWEKGDSRFFTTFMTTLYNAPLDASGNAMSWGTEGYLAYYNCTADELAKKPIACIYYPEYYTAAEVEADLATKQNQTKKFETGAYGINEPFAAIVSGETVYRWKFNTDGSLAAMETIDPMEDLLKNASAGGLIVRKFDDPNSDIVTSGNCYRNIPVHHVSEMYLVAAEAYLLADNTSASLEKLNDVRMRAGLAKLNSFSDYTAPYVTNSSYTATPLDLVLDERAREMYAERTRFFDLRRTKQLVRYNIEFARSISSVSQMQNGKGETKWYRPIPQDEINNNESISADDQNPGY